MAKIPLKGLGMAGLNSDAPAQTLDATTFNSGNNIRPFDGSLQACLAFAPFTDLRPVNSDARDIYAFTQWTKSGEGTLNIAYLYDPSGGDGDNLSLQIVEDLTEPDVLDGAIAATPVNDNSRFGLDMFVFNDVVIINDGYNHPVWVSKDTDENYTAKLLPGWPLAAVTTTVANDEYFNIDESGNLTLAQWRDILNDQTLTDSGIPVVGARFTAQAAVSVSSGLISRPTTAERIVPFNNRLVALNISEEYIGSESYGNTTMIWSTQITALGTLDGLSFVAASSNTAGDDIITETPGEILDAGPLGNQLMVYKEDAVFYVADTGEPLYLVTQLATGDDGIFSPQCWADIGQNRHLVAGNYGIYTFDGGINKSNLSRGRIERALFSAVNSARRDDTFVFHHQADKEVWICYASNGFSGSGCDSAFVFNYETNTWYQRDLRGGDNNGFRGISATELMGELRIFGWGEDGVFQLSSERLEIPVYVSDGYVTFDLQDFDDATTVKHISSINPFCGTPITVELGSQGNLQQTPLDYGIEKNFDPATMYKLDYREHGRFFNLRMTQQGTMNPSISGIELTIKGGGER